MGKALFRVVEFHALTAEADALTAELAEAHTFIDYN